MTRYFAQNTPRAGLEHMMMSVPGFQKRGGGMMILSRFCYKPEDVDCRYCLHYRRRSCQVRTCPYIAERLKSGAIEYLDLILEYFGHIPHAGLHKRIQAVEHWSGPDQAVLHTVSVHLRSRFADRVWDDAPPGYLAALYLLASKERLWQPALPALSHDSIDFSRIVSKPHGFAIQDYPIFYSARRLYDLKSPMEAEDLAHPKLVSDLDFHNIIYATMIARYVHLWQPDDWSIQTEQERFAPKVAEGLPELCFSTLRTTGQLICIKRGETGYYPSDWDTGDKEGNVELADELNEDLGVTPIQRQAIDDEDGIEQADEFAKRLAQIEREWPESDMVKYKALLSVVDHPSLQDATRLMGEIDQYELRPEVAQTWGYAEMMFREKYSALPEELFQTPQAAQIGQKMLDDRLGVITEYGLIRRKDGQPLPVFQPEQEIGQGLEMM